MFASFEGHLLGVLVAMGLLAFMVVKIVSAVDDDGEVKKTAKNGFAEVFRKLFKK